MLVYGDAERLERAGALIAGLRERLTAVALMPPGLGRHAGLVAALIEAGELWQGLADAELEAGGTDAASPAQEAAAALCLALGRMVRASWTSGFETTTSMPALDLPA